MGVEVGGKFIKAEQIISTVPYFVLQSLLPNAVQSIEPFCHLHKFKSSPIVSIHLWFDEEFMADDFIGAIDMNLQWIFNRRKLMDENKPTSYISAVISGAHEEVKLSKDELVNLALNDLHRIFSTSGNRKQKTGNSKLLHSVVIKEKRATFSPTPELEPYRPNTVTPIQNLFLAGDWTNTGLPATIEGAVKSGLEAACQCNE